MTKSAPDYYSSVSIAGKHDTEMKPILVDTDGQMYIVMTGQTIDVGTITTMTDKDRIMQGKAEGNFPVIALDASGIMLSRMKGAASGELILKILDDCGDTSTITDWGELDDGLNPVDNQVYVKQGNHSMALGIDASLSGEDRARWVNTDDKGDLSNYQHDWIYMWVYFPTLDYMISSGNAIIYTIGSDVSNRVYFYVDISDLNVGWNLLKFDLDNPDGTSGNPNWGAIDYQYFIFYEKAGNTNDFTIYVDSIMFVRPTPGAGTLKDIAVDENGIMLSKMTGQYADILKPIAIDQDGFMLAVMKGDFEGSLKTIGLNTNGYIRADITAQALNYLKVSPTYGRATRAYNIHTATQEAKTTIKTINGRGAVLGGWIYWDEAAVAGNLKIGCEIDDATVFDITPSLCDTFGLTDADNSILYLKNYVEADPDWHYCMGIGSDFAFDSKVVFVVTNPYVRDISVNYHILYALITT